MRTVADLVRYLSDRGVRAAVIGAIALARHGIARATQDVDLLVTDRRVLDAGFWNDWGEESEIRRGDADDPLAGAVACALDDAMGDVDLVVGKYQWMGEAVERAEELQMGPVRLPVVTAADLILLKLYAGGPQDLLDVRMLLAARPELVAQIEERLGTLPAGLRRLWRDVNPGD